MGKSLNPMGGDDVVMTPEDLAKKIVDHFSPTGKLLEPCCGTGNFLKFMKDADWCEINKGINFFDYKNYVDWIITNPPFSKIRKFLLHAYSLNAENIVFLIPLNHLLGLKARMREMLENGYGIKEILICDTPETFPQSGFQIGVYHIKRGYSGNIKFGKI